MLLLGHVVRVVVVHVLLRLLVLGLGGLHSHGGRSVELARWLSHWWILLMHFFFFLIIKNS